MEIPDPPIRRDALSALAHKRGHTDGAALFSILTRARDSNLLRLLVAYEIIWDYLDSVNERGAAVGQANGRQLHLALVEALDPRRAISDYYRYHPWKRDGGYLRALVESCRETCARLPSYERVRPFLLRETMRAQVLAVNHDPDPVARDDGLRRWAEREVAEKTEASWFELSGAASASLTVHALLALGAERLSADTDISRVQRAYFPWISAATTMLDSYVDQAEDVENKDHCYVAHYPAGQAVRRISELVRRSLLEAAALPDGERHILITACMLAMYLSKDSARTKEMSHATCRLIDAGGSLTRLLLPILRAWRILYAQRST